MQVETKYWIHPDGWVYVGDEMDGARVATQAEIDEHLAKNISTDMEQEIAPK
ncbi:hypothetical protein ACSMDK_11645 [Yersinia enterocolitica]|uniref:hypothetical protein n=1 Tax=Yersinia enterocolitica TaxID=630 RepID=UPI003F51AFF1